MKKTLRSLLVVTTLAVVTVSLTGCTVGQSVPKLQLTVDPVTHAVALNNPKDTTIRNFHAEVTTNGASIVTFESLTTVMNPDVITTTGDAQAKMISATGKAVTDAISAGGTAAASAATSGLISK